MCTWSPARNDTVNSPLAFMIGYVSCLGDTLAMMIGSSNDTCVTQCEV